MPNNMLEPNYNEPYNAWMMNPSPETMGPLLKAVDPVLKTAARSFTGPSAKNTNIHAQAKQLAAEAFSTYDPQKGPLKAHLMSRLQRLRRVAAQQRQIIRLPEQVAVNQMQISSATAELEDKLGRPPSSRELADYTGLSMKRLAYVQGSGRPLAESTISRMDDEGRGGYDPSVRSLAIEQDPWQEFIYDDVDATNQFIMERALGMHGHKPTSPTKIAQMLKISPAAVSQRMAYIQAKLDKRDELGML